jgi:hypothetical protein
LFALLTFATSIYWPFQYDPNDDWVAYLAFPEKILQTGTLLEPFSQRRITSLCGHSILLAQIMIVAEPESAHLLDRGLGAILLFGILVEATQKTAPSWQWLRALFILAAVTVSDPRINTSSTVLGVCLMFAFLFALERSLTSNQKGWNSWILPSLFLAGASSLRFTYALAGGGAVILFFTLKSLRTSRQEFFSSIASIFTIGLITLAFMAPLMIVSWQSSGTPIYPPFSGNGHTEFFYCSSGKGFLSDAFTALQMMCIPMMSVMLLAFPILIFLSGNNRLMSIAISMPSLLLVFLVGVNGSAAVVTWTMDFYRISFPIAALAYFWILCKMLINCQQNVRISSQAITFLAVASFLAVHYASATEELKAKLTVFQNLDKTFKFQASNLKPYYDQLQNAIPKGEKIFAIVDAPYLLDYKRNEISNVDNIAVASPSPGMPFKQGPEALKKYLSDLGFKYILAVDFNQAVFLYNKGIMANHPRQEYREFSKNFVVDFLNNIDSISYNNTLTRNANSRLIFLE